MSDKKRMPKAELISELANNAGVSKTDALKVLLALRDIIIEQLKKGVAVVIPDLVKIEAKDRAARSERVGRNPATGEAIKIPAKPASKLVRSSVISALKVSVLQ
jgi:nucleoid DNA-binding protein